MFAFASKFNQELKNFDTLNVKNMAHMFDGASKFNQSLGEDFNTSKVVNMSHMFASARIYIKPLGESFNTSRVKDMSYMFYFAKSFDQPFSDEFNTSSVVDMSHMFHRATRFNQPLGVKFTTKSAKNISNMFHGAKAFNQDLDFIKLNSINKISSENFGRLLYGAKSISAGHAVALLEELVNQYRRSRSKFSEIQHLDLYELPQRGSAESYNSVFCDDGSESEVRINWLNDLGTSCL